MPLRSAAHSCRKWCSTQAFRRAREKQRLDYPRSAKHLTLCRRGLTVLDPTPTANHTSGSADDLLPRCLDRRKKGCQGVSWQPFFLRSRHLGSKSSAEPDVWFAVGVGSSTVSKILN